MESGCEAGRRDYSTKEFDCAEWQAAVPMRRNFHGINELFDLDISEELQALE